MPDQASAPPSDAILTVPNLLTFFRLGLIPVFLYAAIGAGNMGWAVVIAALGFVTDLVDGKIARRYGQVSKLGIALDPLSDRLGLASGAPVLKRVQGDDAMSGLKKEGRQRGAEIAGGPGDENIHDLFRL